ncbi:energy transducer TonB family protein [Achromobacter pestifer]|uniref:Energy transducer TonB n=1 Tax=Achromobacter pestifer TaxID=1353889 RepID=A0A6S6Z2P3_9BURK|nr:energy transducer TonB [Achromobacter pestifer]CAB3647231.1 hypothetical protein LMG3431_02551 [Achromobacter pestifer]
MTEPNPNRPPQAPEQQELAGLFAEKQAEPRRDVMRVVKPVVAVLIVGVLGYFAWQWISDMSGVQRKPPEMTAIIPLPPPPPPPPEPEKPPEPEEPPPEEKMVEPEPEPTPAEEPKPAEDAPPTPADSAADPMEMNADAQAGSDAFNIGAGTRGGMAGSGGGGRLGNATYGQYLGYALQKTLREAESTRNLVYRLSVDLWINREGQVTRAEITRSSGDPAIDDQVLAVLRSTAFDQRPTSTTTMPAKVALTSRRPS